MSVSGFAAGVLALALVGGLLRVVLGPTRVDRMIAAQLVGTIGVGLLLLLAEAGGLDALRNVALVLATLATVVTLAFVRLAHWAQDES